MPEIGDKDTDIFKTVHDRYVAEDKAGNFIREKPAVEKARDSLGGMTGDARDAIDSRPEKIEHDVKDATGE